jgi:DNA-binding MarR family transcriptional regulator
MSAEDHDANLDGLTEIDRVVHEPARLLVLCNLYVLESADFLFLLRKTGLTRGNLSAHMRKLETAGYVDVEKTFVDRLPLTVYRITEDGRTALRKYRKQLTSGLSVVT